jgi:hypothetical protein
VQDHDTGTETTSQDEPGSGRDNDLKGYLRFGAMIVTAMAAMYALTYLNSMELSHVRWSETRAYMTLLMGGVMALIMLAFMLSMYRNWKWNAVIIGISVVLFGAALWLVRSQTTVQDESFMRAMIPHHSIAILTSERSETSDIRVCELQVAIIEAQRREIAEMDWLLADIAENGYASTPAESADRAVPEFTGEVTRECASG